MTQPAPCLTQLADDLENHGNLLALLTELPSLKLSERGRVGLSQFSLIILRDFQRIEGNFKNYRASIAPSN